MGGEVAQSPAVTVGEKLTVSIHDIAFGGEGVARLDDFVVFVPFTMVCEVVEVEITEVKKRFARSKLVRVLNPSPMRVEPLCPYFGDCGGCQYQHISYPAQLEIKRKQIADLFQRIGPLKSNSALTLTSEMDVVRETSSAAPGERGQRVDGGVVAPVVPCPQPYGYRNRVMIRSQWDKLKQGLNIGFIRADNRLVIDIEECKISEPAINEQIKRVRANPPPKGGIKVTLRIPPEGWEVPPHSFFQNNFFLLPKLVETVRDRVSQSRARFLVDAYCGVGFFSIELADLVEWFVGVELDAHAVKAARKNAVARGRTNGEFILGATEEFLPNIMARFRPEESVIVLDPPRTGCSAGSLELLRQSRPAQVIYVSCHPATLARDLNVLCADGVFELARVIPLDMFPQTQHVECVADLRCPVPASPDKKAAAR